MTRICSFFWSSFPFSTPFGSPVFSGGYKMRILVRNLWNTLPLNTIKTLTHFLSMFPFHTPWKHKKLFRFLVFSWGKKWELWPEMDLCSGRVINFKYVIPCSTLLYSTIFIQCFFFGFNYLYQKLRNTTVNIYLFKLNNRNTTQRCEICLKLIIKAPEWGRWCQDVFWYFY